MPCQQPARQRPGSPVVVPNQNQPVPAAAISRSGLGEGSGSAVGLCPPFTAPPHAGGAWRHTKGCKLLQVWP